MGIGVRLLATGVDASGRLIGMGFRVGLLGMLGIFPGSCNGMTDAGSGLSFSVCSVTISMS